MPFRPGGFAVCRSILCVCLLTGCSGPLSTLDPGGPAAQSIATLWWVMLAGSAALFALVMLLLLLAFAAPGRAARIRPGVWLIGGGLALPALVLTPLLAYGLIVGERLVWPKDAQVPVRVHVTARMWEWVFTYSGEGSDRRVSINVLHVPAGVPVELRVNTADVIHSFWVPRLAGKIDAIPGHVNVLRFTADRPGTYRGQCAEFCGIGHTGMDMTVEAHDAADYEAVLRARTTRADGQAGAPR